ncbi:MAG: VIT domain-containing protein [bacterium]
MKRRIHFLLAVLTLICTAATAHADGILIPGHWPSPRPLPEPIPAFAIKYHHVDVTIDGQIARTKIDQVFVSEANREIEATYLFPIPAGATIDEFKLWINNEPIPGQIMGKDEARRIYEEIVRQRKDPALLEYVDRGLIKARVYPIPPHGEQRIQIEYTEILTRNNNVVKYSYPLNTEKFSSRPIETVRINMDIRSDIPIKNVYSSSHAPSIRRPSERTATVSHEESNSRPDMDFTIYYSLSEDEVGLGLLTYQSQNEDGYFLLLAAPRAEIQEDQIAAKDVVFVFDRTGSMSGEKIEQAREALKFSLNNLNSRDRFNVITFNESPDPLFSSLVPAHQENIDKALVLADGLTAEGGTNIDEALTTALPMVAENERPCFVLFLTDGLPTVGVKDVKTILANAARVAPSHVRLFVFGVGYDVNTLLLDKLAQEHSGAPEYVRPGEDLEIKVSNLYRKISYPILTDMALDFDGIEPYDVFPQHLPDLFKGSQIVVTGRYRNSGRTDITLTGQAGGRSHRFELRQTVAKDDRSHDFIPQLWANRKIAFLLGEIRLNGQTQELVAEIVRLSKQYGIITEYTSFLVEEPTMVFAPDYAEVAEMAFGLENSDRLAATTGGSAVNQSLNLKSKGAAMSAPAANAQSYFDERGDEVVIKQVYNIANRTFFQQDKGWYENTYSDDMEVLNIRNYSRAQFQLLDRDPSLGKLMSLGDEVLLLINGNAVKIGDSGLEELSEELLERLFGA